MGTTGRTLLSVIAAAALLPACAEGGGDNETGRGGGDGSVARRDGGFMLRRDAGRVGDGGGGGPSCTDDRSGGSCATATDLGAVPVGGTAMGDVARIPVAGGEDWYSVTFAPLGAPMTYGGGMPTIQLTMNEGDAFRFDVMSACGTPVSCAMGGTAGAGTGLSQYTYTDDQAMPGESQWSTRDQAWPTALKIRVYRTTMGASCAQYMLHVSR